MGGGKSQPAPPDYSNLAREQAAINKETAAEQNYANRGDVVTPWGKQSYSTRVVKDPITGKEYTTYDKNVALDPEQQAALDAQQQVQAGRSTAAAGMLDRATSALETPLDFGALPAGAQALDFRRSTADPNTQQAFSFGPGVNMDPSSLRRNPIDSGYRQKAQDATMALMQPMLDRRRQAAELSVLNKGGAEGSEAYKDTMRDVADYENRAMLQAIGEGRSEADLDLRAGQQGYNQELGAMRFGNEAQQQAYEQAFGTAGFGNRARQTNLENVLGMDQDWLQQQIQAGGYEQGRRSTALDEAQLERGMGLDDINRLLSGQGVNVPGFENMQANVGAGPDLMSAVQQQYGDAMGAANARNASKANTTAAVGSVAAMALMVF